MDDYPLAMPKENSPLLQEFLTCFGISAEPLLAGDPLALIASIGRAFSRIPYENLSKILLATEGMASDRALRGPSEVFAEYRRRGAGGTCFSLTALLLHVLRALGLRAEPILADRHYGADTHCALIVWVAGSPHLLDPGYLITDPVPLGAELLLASAEPIPERLESITVPTRFNDVVLVPREEGRRLELHTRQHDSMVHRLTFKTTPVDPGAFLRAWNASFSWDGMRYPVLSRVHGNRQLYLQGCRFQVRTRESVRREEISQDRLVATIQREFGLDGGLAAAAVKRLRRRGETS